MMMKQCRQRRWEPPKEPVCGCEREPERRRCISAGAYEGFGPAMVLVPAQNYTELYTPDEALVKGTLFKQLDMPFHAGFRL